MLGQQGAEHAASLNESASKVLKDPRLLSPAGQIWLELANLNESGSEEAREFAAQQAVKTFGISDQPNNPILYKDLPSGEQNKVLKGLLGDYIYTRYLKNFAEIQNLQAKSGLLATGSHEKKSLTQEISRKREILDTFINLVATPPSQFKDKFMDPVFNVVQLPELWIDKDEAEWLLGLREDSENELDQFSIQPNESLIDVLSEGDQENIFDQYRFGNLHIKLRFNKKTLGRGKGVQIMEVRNVASTLEPFRKEPTN